MFNLNSICKSFGNLMALNKLDLKVAENSITGLIGTNGSGKTTLINIMTGIYTPDSGSIFFNQQNITGKPTEEFAHKKITRTFQNVRLFKDMTVLENILAALVSKDIKKTSSWVFKSLTKNKLNLHKAIEVLEIMNLKEHRHLFTKELSLSMMRKLEIARALAVDPLAILMDEPAGGMTSAETSEILEIINNYVAPGRTIILIEHKMDLISKICNELVVLNNGKIIIQGETQKILSNKNVLDTYIGI